MDKPEIPDFFINPNNMGGNFDPDKFLQKFKAPLIVFAILFALLASGSPVHVIQAGERGVVFNRITGTQKRVLEEGLQFVIPVLETVSKYNVREISYIFSDKSFRSKSGTLWMGESIHTLTADGQAITVEITVRARPDFKELWWLHQNIGNSRMRSYVEKIITPVVKSMVREVISGFTVSGIYSEERRTIANKISERLAGKLQGYKIVLSEFLLDEVMFSQAYQNAIEQKQQATIELDTKDNVIVEERGKRDAAVTRAEGEAEAIRRKVESLARNPSYLKFRKAQVLGKRAKLIVEDEI